ncbi:hypothetical protein SDC9_165232 [bioreactor metagenome]|uniref:Uncharacterized protein n=1 Tax=bioreactor metagenome TaxID=1076179 RepID=A0A645FTS4_9ZZZZ
MFIGKRHAGTLVGEKTTRRIADALYARLRDDGLRRHIVEFEFERCAPRIANKYIHICSQLLSYIQYNMRGFCK